MIVQPSYVGMKNDPNYFRSSPAVNIRPSANKMTARTFGLWFTALKICLSYSKKAEFIAFRAFGLLIATFMMSPSSS